MVLRAGGEVIPQMVHVVMILPATNAMEAILAGVMGTQVVAYVRRGVEPLVTVGAVVRVDAGVSVQVALVAHAA